MASGEFSQNGSVPDARSPSGLLSGFLGLGVFAVALAAFALLTSQLLTNGFSDPGASRLLGVLTATSGAAADSLGRVYPVVPYLFSRGLFEVGVFTGAAPYYADCFAAAVLVALGFLRLHATGSGFLFTLALMTVLVANPIFLYAATSGSGLAWALLMTYVFGLGVMALARDQFLRGGLLVGVAYTGILLSSPLGFYILLVAAPFLVFASRQQFMAAMPGSTYMALAVLPLAVFAILIAAHFALTGEAGLFLQSLTGAPRLWGGSVGLEPWPFMMGNAPVAVAGVVLAGLFLAFPVLMLSLSGVFAGFNMLRATLIMAGVAMVAGVVTTYLGVLSHPAYLWAFAVPPTLIALEQMRSGFGGRILAVIALMAGISGSWWLMGLHPTLNLTVWRAEIGSAFVQMARGFPAPAEAAPQPDQ